MYAFNYDSAEQFLHGVIAIPARKALEKKK